MRLHRPFALLCGVTLVLGAVAMPSLASASTATSAAASASPSTLLTPAALLSDLQAVETATSAADQDGWSEKVNVDLEGFAEGLQVRYAPLEGRAYVALTGGGAPVQEIEVQHRGLYAPTALAASTFGSAAYVRRLLADVGRPHATWVYVADSKTDLTDPQTGVAGSSPASMISPLLDSHETTINATPSPTESELANGEIQYTFSGTTTDGSAATTSGADGTETGTFTVTVKGAAAIGYSEALSDDGGTVTATFVNGQQNISLPPAADVVSMSTLERGVQRLMLADARTIAATVHKQVAKKKHTSSATVSLIRKDAATLVAKANKADGKHIFARRNITGGVRLTGTNPFTHATVVYTVKAAGKKAIVHHV